MAAKSVCERNVRNKAKARDNGGGGRFRSEADEGNAAWALHANAD